MAEIKMFSWSDVIISNLPTPALFKEMKDSTNVFPFYLCSEIGTQPNKEQPMSPTPVLNTKIVKQIARKLGMAFVPEKEREGKVCYISNPEVRDDYKTTFAAIDMLDYIFAVLHSPTYREKYEEFLKIDFPGIPFPKNTKTFWRLVELGKQIRQIYSLEAAVTEKWFEAMPGISNYPVDGDNRVGEIIFTSNTEPACATGREYGKVGKVYINFEKDSPTLEELQYFDNVPESAWNFYIGDYQLAQKWLKDRKGRTLNFEDIEHYRKIIVALAQTDRLMKEIEKIDIG